MKNKSVMASVRSFPDTPLRFCVNNIFSQRITYLFAAATLTTLLLSTDALAKGKKIYEITLEDIDGGGRMLAFSFHGTPPAPDFVDKLLRNALEVASVVEPSENILGMAFAGDEVMTPNQYSGDLIYKADTKQILTMDEYRGVKKSEETRARYHLAVKEDKTYEGITPERRWLSASLVYPAQPDRATAYEDMLSVAKEMAPKGMDVNMYIFVGEKDKETSWQQVRDIDGTYMACIYNAQSRKVTRKDEILGVITE